MKKKLTWAEKQELRRTNRFLAEQYEKEAKEEAEKEAFIILSKRHDFLVASATRWHAANPSLPDPYYGRLSEAGK
jgi:hypothetical protein